MYKLDIVETLQKLVIAIFVTILSTTLTMKFFDLIICILMGHKGHRKVHMHDSSRNDFNEDNSESEDK